MNRFAITVDTDWAADYLIESAAAILRENEIKSTWFVTHLSPAIEGLRDNPDLFELGIHPNFLPNSTQGKDTTEILHHMMEMVPDAVSMRSHAVMQSGPILNEVVAHTSIRFDSTIFLPEMPNIEPVIHLTPHGSLKRIPFFWADDYEMMKPEPAWNFEKYIDIPGMKILLFHPIHIALNSNNLALFSDIKAKINDNDYENPEKIKHLSHDGLGSRTFFLDVIKTIKRNIQRDYMFKEIADET